MNTAFLPLPPGADVEILRPKEWPPLDPVAAFLEAVENPVGAPPLSRLAEAGGPVVVIVPDKSRRFPTSKLLPPLLDHLARRRAGPVTVLIAHALHRPHSPRDIGLDPAVLCGARVLNHGLPPARSLVTVGTVPVFGRLGRKSVRVNALAARARLVVALGTIAPHAMAGFSGGAKSIVPGVAGAGTTALNHLLMVHPKSRWGIVDGNPVREDLERAARLLPAVFCVNAVFDGRRRVAAVVAGDLVAAHRAGVEIARSVGEVRARRAELVVAAAEHPEAMSAFHALKLVVPASKVVKPGGTVVLAAECPEGSGEMNPLSRAMFDLVTRKNLPPGARVFFYSPYPGRLKLPSFAGRVASLAEAMERRWPKDAPRARLTILEAADLLLPRPPAGSA